MKISIISVAPISHGAQSHAIRFPRDPTPTGRTTVGWHFPYHGNVHTYYIRGALIAFECNVVENFIRTRENKGTRDEERLCLESRGPPVAGVKPSSLRVSSTISPKRDYVDISSSRRRSIYNLHTHTSSRPVVWFVIGWARRRWEYPRVMLDWLYDAYHYATSYRDHYTPHLFSNQRYKVKKRVFPSTNVWIKNEKSTAPLIRPNDQLLCGFTSIPHYDLDVRKYPSTSQWKCINSPTHEYPSSGIKFLPVTWHAVYVQVPLHKGGEKTDYLRYSGLEPVHLHLQRDWLNLDWKST